MHKGKAREDQQINYGCRLDIVTLIPSMGVQSVHGHDRCRNHHDQRTSDQHIQGLASRAQEGMPANLGLLGTENMLGEDQVDNVNKKDSSVHEDICRDSEADVTLSGGPSDSQDQRCDSSHTEAKE